MKYIIFNFILSFVFNVALAAPLDWKSLARDLLARDGKEDAARTKLKKIGDLDRQLLEALKKEGRDERLALNTIGKLKRLTLIDDLFKKIQSWDASQERTEAYLVMLASMTDSARGSEILERLIQKVDLTSQHISAPLKMTVLSAMQNKEKAPSLKIMNSLLDDESYELRQKVVDMTPYVVGDSGDKEKFLQKALQISPYPVRLSAIREIRTLPGAAQARLKSAILKCAQQDQNSLVKEQCQNFQFAILPRLVEQKE